MHTPVQLELLFKQSLAGIFFMMLDEPVVWNDTVDKEKVLDYVFDHHRITEANQAMLDQYRTTAAEFTGATPNQLFAHDLAYGRSVWREFFDQGCLHIDTNEKRMDGSRMAVLGDYICLYDDLGRITGHFGVQIDITERAELIEEREQHVALQQFFSISPDLMFIRDDKGVVRKANQAWQTILGYGIDDLEKFNLTDLIHPEDRLESDFIFKPSEIHQMVSRVFRMQTQAGTYRSIEWFSQTVDGWLYATGRDVSEQLCTKEQLEILASRDNLTGLYNRHHFDTVINDLMEHADRYNEPLACFLFDLDHFKTVNDTHGHPVGDDVLKYMDAGSRDKSVLASSRLDWQPIWNSGNDQIDNQHQKLILIANQLLQLYLSNAKPQQLHNQLELMFQHVIVHFETEEKILADVGYPDLASHARIHEKLVAKLNRLYQDYQAGDVKPSAFFSFVLDDVLVEHLAKVDTLFFDWTSPKE